MTRLVQVAARAHRDSSALLFVGTDSGHVGIGEATRPDDGERADATRIAATAMAALTPIELPPGRELVVASELAIALASGAPATRFAIETALLDAAAKARGLPLAALLSENPVARLPINALVDDAAAASEALAHGITCIKTKTRGDFHDDWPRVSAIRAALGDAVALRIDANQAWPAARIPEFLGAAAALAVEYVEEPGRDLAPTLTKPLAAPVALDESLVRDDRHAWLGAALRSGAVVALVLKPGRLGGLSTCVVLADEARRAGVDTVVTHAFDGPVALAVACELALALGGRRAAGLAPHAGLASWPQVTLPQLTPNAVVSTPRTGHGAPADYFVIPFGSP